METIIDSRIHRVRRHIFDGLKNSDSAVCRERGSNASSVMEIDKVSLTRRPRRGSFNPKIPDGTADRFHHDRSMRTVRSHLFPTAGKQQLGFDTPVKSETKG